MSLTKLTANLNVHQNKPDKPVDTAEKLKQDFDRPVNDIKTYINNTLTSEVDTALGTKANSSEVYTKTETNTLLETKADSDIIKTEEIMIRIVTQTTGGGFLNEFNLPDGYKVLTASVVNINTPKIVASISGIDNSNHYVHVTTLGETGGYEVTVTVRMIYIKE